MTNYHVITKIHIISCEIYAFRLFFFWMCEVLIGQFLITKYNKYISKIKIKIKIFYSFTVTNKIDDSNLKSGLVGNMINRK